MSMYSSLEGTNVPSSQSGLPNVSQYGWSSYEMEEYKQLVEYVDEAKQYSEQAQQAYNFIVVLKDTIDSIKTEIDNINTDISDKKAQIDQMQATISTWYSQIESWKVDIQNNVDSITNMLAEIQELLNQIKAIRDQVQLLKDAAEESQVQAKTSEINALSSANKSEEMFNKCYELYESLRKGQVYRGAWNPHTNAYPDPKGTNSVWDVVLNEGEQEYIYDNKRWYWGDRLFYVIDDSTYYQLESGSNVKSVNGKTGAVVLNSTDVGALSSTDNTVWKNRGALTNLNHTAAVRPGYFNYNPSCTGSPEPASYGHGFVVGPGSDAGSGVWASQFAFSHTGKIYTRNAVNKAPQDSDWKRVYTTTDKPTPSEVGAVNKTGDTMTGNLEVPQLTSKGISVYGDGSWAFVKATGKDGVILHVDSAKAARVKVGNSNSVPLYHEMNKPTPADINAFKADGITSTVPSDPGVAWNANSGVYAATVSGASNLVAHFKGGHSCPALQIRAGYKNGGLWYRSARDNFGFEEGWDRIYTYKDKPTPAQIGAYTTAEANAKFVDVAGDTMTGTLNVPNIKITGGDVGITNNGNLNLIRSGGSNVHTVVGNTSGNIYLDTQNGMAAVRSGSTEHRIYHQGFKPTAPDVGAADATVGNEIKLLTTSNSGRTKEVQIFSKEGRLYGVSADGTKTQFYNDRTYRPTLADFGGLGVDNGNELNPPSNSSNFYFGYRKTGAQEINTYHFMNNKAQQNGYGDVKAKEFYAQDGTKRVYHEGFKPDLGQLVGNTYSVFKTTTIPAPAGVVAGKYYPVVLSNMTASEDIKIETRSAGGSDPMNNCSFSGVIRAGGWSDKNSYAAGQFTIYSTEERAIHSIVVPSENDSGCAIYVEARAFPVTVRARSNITVSCTGVDAAQGTTTFKAGITLSENPAIEVYGTKIIKLLNFDGGNNYYTSRGIITSGQYKSLRADNVFESIGGYLNSSTADFLAVLGKKYAFASAPNAAFLSANARYDAGWKKYDNSKVSWVIGVNEEGPKVYHSQASNDNPVQQSFDIYHTGRKPTATDVGLPLVPNTKHTTAAEANTVPIRDGSGDISARLFKSSYADQSTISGAMAFRINNGSDNYIRFCSDKAAIKTWLGVDTSQFVKKAGDEMTGQLTLNSTMPYTGASAQIYHYGKGTTGTRMNIRSMKESVGATWLWEQVANGSLWYTDGTTGARAAKVRLDVQNGEMYLQDATKRVYHTGYKPTPADIGAVSKTGDTMTGTLTAKSFVSQQASSAFTTGQTGGNGYGVISAESGYVMLWRRRAGSTTHADEFIGINSGSQLLFRQDAGKGDKTYRDNLVYHTANKPTAADVGAVNKAGDTMTGTLTIARGGNEGLILKGANGQSNYLSANRGGSRQWYIGNGNGTDDTYFHNDAHNTSIKMTSSSVVFNKDLYVNDNRVYHTANKPTAADVVAIGGITKTNFLRNGTEGYWQTLARVRMPQSASLARFTITGGSGYNVGEVAQCDITEIVIRSGNGTPKGITAVVYVNGGSKSLIMNIAWKLVSGEDYDIFVQTRNYGGIGTRVDYMSASSTLVSWGTDNPVATKPEGVADGLVVTSYNTRNKPTGHDVGVYSSNKIVVPSGYSGGSGATVKNQKTSNVNESWLTSRPDSDSAHKAIGVNETDGPVYWNGTTKHKIYNQDFKPTAADVGALSTTGGTMTGEIYSTSSTQQFKGPVFGNGDVNNLCVSSQGRWSYASNVYNGAPNNMPASNNANGILTFNTHEGAYNHQVGMSSNGKLYHRFNKGTWSQIYTSTTKPTPADIGALATTGGTVTGNATFNADVNVNTGALKVNSVDICGVSSEVVRLGDGTFSRPLRLNAKDGLAYVQVGVDAIRRMYHEGFKPTAADVGALPITGGTLTGTLVSNSEIRTSDIMVGVKGFATAGDISIDASKGRRHIAFNVTGPSDIMHIFADPGDRTFKISAPVKLSNCYHGVHIDSPLSGESNFAFRCTPQPMGWNDWRTVSPALQIDCPSANVSAYTIWRATQWGNSHLAMMAVHAPGGDANQTVINMSLGGFNNQFSFQANGNAAATGTWVSGSDRRFKENIIPVSESRTKEAQSWLERVCTLTANRYNYKTDSNKDVRLGFIAQDVQEVIPEAVTSLTHATESEESTDRLFLDPTAIIAAQNEAIKELNEITKSQQAQIDELRAMVLALTK